MLPFKYKHHFKLPELYIAGLFDMTTNRSREAKWEDKVPGVRYIDLNFSVVLSVPLPCEPLIGTIIETNKPRTIAIKWAMVVLRGILVFFLGGMAWRSDGWSATGDCRYPALQHDDWPPGLASLPWLPWKYVCSWYSMDM